MTATMFAVRYPATKTGMNEAFKRAAYLKQRGKEKGFAVSTETESAYARLRHPSDAIGFDWEPGKSLEVLEYPRVGLFLTSEKLTREELRREWGQEA